MAQVNYVKEMESFSVYAEANALSRSERLVWLGLFHQFNARAFGNEWPDGYIELRRSQLALSCGVSVRTLIRARDALAERGLIDYMIGGGDSGNRYRMVYISVYGAPQEASYADRKVCGVVDNSADPCQNGTTPCQNDTTPCQNDTGKTRDVVTTEYKHSVNVDINVEDEDIYNNKPTARARGDSADAEGTEEDGIGEAFLQLIGRKASPVEIGEIREVAAWCSSEDSLVCEALRRAGGAGAQSAGRYAARCLMRWSDQGLRTLEELETCERLEDLSKSARPDIAAKGREKLGAFLRELKIKHRMVNAV